MDEKKVKILEIGCGNRPYLPVSKSEEVVHLDIIKLPHVEVVWDLNKFPYPFKSNEFDVVIAKNVLEHLDDLIKLMEELWRITKPGGILKITVPYFASPVAFSDPTHKHFFTLNTFDYWDPTTKSGKKYYFQLSTKAKFKVVKKRLQCPSIVNIFLKIHPKLYENILSRIIPAAEIYFELKVIK